MSVEHITWALRQPVKPSSTKFVLVVLANCASGDTGLAYPSTAYLADATGQDRKTVIANLNKLRDCGLIEDTGKRVGTTKQIPVYRLNSTPDLFAEESQKRNSSENGTVPKSPGNSTVFPHKQSQKRDTEPSGTVRNQREGAAPRGTRLPAEWKPDEQDQAYAVEKGIDWRVEAEAFRDYWLAAPSSRGLKADWHAAWRTWVRRARRPEATTATNAPRHPDAAKVLEKARAQRPASPATARAALAEAGALLGRNGAPA